MFDTTDINIQNSNIDLSVCAKQHGLFSSLSGGESKTPASTRVYNLSSINNLQLPLDPNQPTKKQVDDNFPVPDTKMFDPVHNPMDAAVSGTPSEYPGAQTSIDGVSVGGQHQPMGYGYLSKAHKQHPFADKICR
jgi:hypothetical protein